MFNKYKIAEKLTTSITATLGFVSFWLFIAGIFPCDAGQGQCGPSPLLFAFIGITVLYLVRFWFSKMKKDVEQHGASVTKSWKLIVPTLLIIQTIAFLPVLFLLIFYSFPSISIEILTLLFGPIKL